MICLPTTQRGHAPICPALQSRQQLLPFPQRRHVCWWDPSNNRRTQAGWVVSEDGGSVFVVGRFDSLVWDWEHWRRVTPKHIANLSFSLSEPVEQEKLVFFSFLFFSIIGGCRYRPQAEICNCNFSCCKVRVCICKSVFAATNVHLTAVTLLLLLGNLEAIWQRYNQLCKKSIACAADLQAVWQWHNQLCKKSLIFAAANVLQILKLQSGLYSVKTSGLLFCIL